MDPFLLSVTEAPSAWLNVTENEEEAMSSNTTLMFTSNETTTIPFTPNDTISVFTPNVTTSGTQNDAAAVAAPDGSLLWVQIYYWVNALGFGSAIFLGTVGNILSLAVLMRKNMRSKTTTIYLVGLAIFDTVALWGIHHNDWFVRLRDVFADKKELVCAIPTMITMLGASISAFYMVALTAERYIAIRFPLKAKFINKMKYARAYAVAMPTILGLSGIPFMYAYVETDEGCFIKPGYEFIAIDIRSVYFTLVRVYLPVGAIAVLNVLIVVELRKQSGTLQETCASSAVQSNLRSSQFRQVTRLVLTVSIFHVVFTVPFTVFIIFVRARGFHLTGYTPSMYVAEAVLSAFSYWNHGFNFVLYILSSPHFRSEFEQMICCCRKHVTASSPPPAVDKASSVKTISSATGSNSHAEDDKAGSVQTISTIAT